MQFSSNARHGLRSLNSGRGEWSIQGSSYSCNLTSGRGNIIRVHASSDTTTTSSENKMEVVYDPQKRIDELTMELNSSSSMPISNLTFQEFHLPSAKTHVAQVNVFLRITGKRPDGYHDLSSLFHVISLGDIIKFSISPSTTKDFLTTNTFGVPLDEKNLIIKAFNLYRRKMHPKIFLDTLGQASANRSWSCRWKWQSSHSFVGCKSDEWKYCK
ncbi:unnamed protein product [Sphagnum troendelagicum]|uniref:4-(cytidine-5'-diphospho)-2-C-methyl-D-erythritol kinase n=1 Tax=Sphagnum troendelagicum TaxID=128251 RepID=A0ABP0UBA7_9BRYO